MPTFLEYVLDRDAHPSRKKLSHDEAVHAVLSQLNISVSGKNDEDMPIILQTKISGYGSDAEEKILQWPVVRQSRNFDKIVSELKDRKSLTVGDLVGLLADQKYDDPLPDETPTDSIY